MYEVSKCAPQEALRDLDKAFTHFFRRMRLKKEGKWHGPPDKQDMGEFRRQMEYKTVWNGETLLIADRFYPSTKRCSSCGHVKAEMSLADRVYVCERETCQVVIDRDFNSARNLAELAR